MSFIINLLGSGLPTIRDVLVKPVLHEGDVVRLVWPWPDRDPHLVCREGQWHEGGVFGNGASFPIGWADRMRRMLADVRNGDLITGVVSEVHYSGHDAAIVDIEYEGTNTDYIWPHELLEVL